MPIRPMAIRYSATMKLTSLGLISMQMPATRARMGMRDKCMFMYSYSMVIEKVAMHDSLARHACHIVPQSHGMFKPQAPRFYFVLNQTE